MAPVMMIIVGVLALIVFVLFGIMVELCRDVRQLRDALGILDRPLDVEIGEVAGNLPSSYGLPHPLDTAAAGLVLFLSDRCATCHALASGLAGSLPPGLWVVLEAQAPQSAEEFLVRYNLARTPRLCVDVAGAIAGKLGLRTTPVAFRVAEGRLTGATTVPSSRYLSSITPNPVRLERPPSLTLKESYPYDKIVENISTTHPLAN